MAQAKTEPQPAVENSYNPTKLEAKYSRLWREQNLYEPSFKKQDSKQAKQADQKQRPPFYNLMMFPYPSAEGLHVGNMYAFTGADVHGRFRRMQGYDVFEPIGLDGFGIHSENYAMKVGRHPMEQAAISQENFYRQLGSIGNSFAWEERLETYDPNYYKWTQWLFIQMFKHGLAYKGEARVNWCPSCKTVLADEQVEDGQCERCKHEVERREMSSWYFAITEYADRLLDNIDHYQWQDQVGKQHSGLNWPNKVTSAQRKWIGRKEGLTIKFSLDQSDDNSKNNQNKIEIHTWTKFWETIFGVTYLVLAPEHELIKQITTSSQVKEVEHYVQQALNKSEQERKIARQKTGVFTGSYAINPANNQKVPIYVGDYVLPDVGTGAVMGVPAHDERDFDFAKEKDLPIIQVVSYQESDPEVDAQVAAGEQASEAAGQLINSQQFDGLSSAEEGKQAMRQWLIEQDFALEQKNYHLRDWLISRQRYWGPPIPLVYCEKCAAAGQGGERVTATGQKLDPIPGWYTVPEDQLPVELPHLDDYQPSGDGTSPLDNASDDWQRTTCPGCGSDQAKRETDVSDTFLDSSWYFLRYPALGHPDHDKHPFPQVKDQDYRQWFPVDAYIGGAEHAVLHLLYARFVTMALYDWGLVPSEEPFPFLFGHGLIIKDGAKMSKSRGNVINPDDYITQHGADALRSYLMFLGPYNQGGDFRDAGMSGMSRWLNRIWESVRAVQPEDETTPQLKRQLHQVIAANTADMQNFKFNTCLARLMEVSNTWREAGQNLSLTESQDFLKLLAPFAPYITEDLYQHLRILSGATDFESIHLAAWPEADSDWLTQEQMTLAIQVNGKLRATLSLPVELAEAQTTVAREEIIDLAQSDPALIRFLEGKEIVKQIVIPGKVVNFVVK